jgi:hypothetical protein
MLQLISLQEKLVLTMRVDGKFAYVAGFSEALDWQMLRLH